MPHLLPMLRDQAMPWLPTLCVVFFLALALASVGVMRASLRRKGAWFLVIMLTGSLAIAASVWQQRNLRQQAKSLGRLAQATGLPAAPLPKPKIIVGRAAAEIAALSQETTTLRSKVANLERSEKGRVIGEALAAKLVAELKQSSGREVVVSCIWGDDEAYDYATQIVDILKRAGWQATGPEPTVIFGNAPDMAIGVYVPDGAVPDTAKILIGAFTKFAVPYQTKVPPTDALPGGSAVELFVSRKPRSTLGEGSTQ